MTTIKIPEYIHSKTLLSIRASAAITGLPVDELNIALHEGKLGNAIRISNQNHIYAEKLSGFLSDYNYQIPEQFSFALRPTVIIYHPQSEACIRKLQKMSSSLQVVEASGINQALVLAGLHRATLIVVPQNGYDTSLEICKSAREAIESIASMGQCRFLATDVGLTPRHVFSLLNLDPTDLELIDA